MVVVREVQLAKKLSSRAEIFGNGMLPMVVMEVSEVQPYMNDFPREVAFANGVMSMVVRAVQPFHV